MTRTSTNGLLIAACLVAAPCLADESDPAVGRRIVPLVVTDTAGRDVSIADLPEKPILVVYFSGTGCPVANLYLPELVKLQDELKENGVQVVAVNSQAGDAAEKIAAHAKEFGVTFPVWCDPRQALADQLGAARTAEVFVLDRQRIVRYHGRIDDRYQPGGVRREQPTRADLRAALDELLAGKPVTVASTVAQGCLIARPRDGAEGKITYASHIDAILRKKCQDCHHPGTAAPFSLLTYDDAVSWSAMLKEVVLQRRMPPWHADPRFGKFSNDCRLSQDEIDTLIAWVDAKTPRGDDSKLPPPRAFPDGWRIGQPDVVFELPREVTVQATGTVDYQYFETPTNFTEDMWIEAAEARPLNRSVVHHIVVFYKEPNKRARLEGNWVIGAAPGDTPLVLPAGVGRKIPKGASLVWQMHYTPTGKEEKDRSQIAFRFCKEKPQHETYVEGIDNHRFRIPAGDPQYRVESSLRVPKDALVMSFMPHMHLRGKAFEYRAEFPDGRKETLLSVPQFDFNWQATYRLAEPVKLPQGTKLLCVAHYDNSAANPSNPDATKTVTWGDQTWEEMMIGYVYYRWDE